MSDTMPKEIFALNMCGIFEDDPEENLWGRRLFADAKQSRAQSYTLTSHHTAEIAKRDRAIEVLMASAHYYAGTNCQPLLVDGINLSRRAIDDIAEAQAILNGEANAGD